MQKCLAFLALFLLTTTAAFAQDAHTETNKAPKGIEKASRDYFMLQLNYEGWNNRPDSVKVKGFGRGVNAYICYDFPIAKSNFSFAAGIGVGTTNIYFDNQQIALTDTGSLGAQARFITETKDYKKYKMTTAYLEAPFELRFFGNKENRNRGFKAAIGFRVGTLVGAHTKGRYSVEGAKVSDKQSTRRYLETWRFAGTVRLGWGNFSLMGTYNINNLFKGGQGPEVTPFSMGICISGL